MRLVCRIKDGRLNFRYNIMFVRKRWLLNSKKIQVID